MTAHDDAGALAEEIQFWDRLSTSFYDAFKLRKHLGPLYFTISVLASHELEGKENTFRLIMRSLTNDPVFGTNPKADLTNYLEHLRELHHVELYDKQQTKIRRDKSRKYFPADTRIAVTPKFMGSTKTFAAGLLEALFGWASRQKADGLALELFKRYLAFVRGQYVPPWNDFLDKLSRASIAEEGQSEGSIRAELVGSTEYYLILHILWAARLRNEDRDGIDLSTIAEKVRRVRPLSDQVVNTYLQFLKRNGLLVGEGRYKLSNSCVPSLEQYTPKLLGMRGAARKHLSDEIASLRDAQADSN